jgi:hypothetical protein
LAETIRKRKTASLPNQLPAQLLARHAVVVPIQRTDAALSEVKLRFLAARHFPAVPLAGAGETAAAGGG